MVSTATMCAGLSKATRIRSATWQQRISGSRDLYPQPDREPNRSVNFITCHDGFTLNDLVSYNQKHNEANLLSNTDGSEANFSWNCGVEGPTDDAQIEKLRIQQIKNFLVVLFTSQGTPMFLMGDEVRRTQSGNNNDFCQDNPISWFDWQAVERQAGLLRFVSKLAAFSQECDLFQQEKFWADPDGPDVIWHGVKLNQPDLGANSHSLAYELINPLKNEHLFIILNAYWNALTFELPHLPRGVNWHCVVDTFKPSPEDFCDPATVLPATVKTYTAQPRSAIVLKAG